MEITRKCTFKVTETQNVQEEHIILHSSEKLKQVDLNKDIKKSIYLLLPSAYAK